MIDYETFLRIKSLSGDKGLTAPQIARELSLTPKTVVKWLQEERYRPKKTSRATSILDPFKDEIVRMLESHPYTAAQVFQQLQEMKFQGGITIVRDYVAKVRPRRSPAFLTLSFAPGECAQVDWGSFGFVTTGSVRRRLSFFVMVLCYSRMAYVEFTVSQTMEHFLTCHQNAFDYFGGIPEKVMVDNLKSAVLKRPVGQPPVFNPKYLEFAGHYGFRIVPCNVAKGNEKGRVENAVGYVKKNFLAGLDIPRFDVLNPAARLWLDNIANVRIHRATRQKPSELMEKERPCLKPLPCNRFDSGTVREVRASRLFRVAFDGNGYSVPAEYAGARLTMKCFPDRICLYHEGKLIARHPRSYDRNQDFEQPDHPKALLEQRKKAKEQKLYKTFLTLSPKAERYYFRLEEKRMNPLLHVKKIVALSEIYGAEQVGRAMEGAFELEAFSSEYIANILESPLRRLPEADELHLTSKSEALELTVGPPDLNVYETDKKPKK